MPIRANACTHACVHTHVHTLYIYTMSNFGWFIKTWRSAWKITTSCQLVSLISFRLHYTHAHAPTHTHTFLGTHSSKDNLLACHALLHFSIRNPLTLLRYAMWRAPAVTSSHAWSNSARFKTTSVHLRLVGRRPSVCAGLWKGSWTNRSAWGRCWRMARGWPYRSVGHAENRDSLSSIMWNSQLKPTQTGYTTDIGQVVCMCHTARSKGHWWVREKSTECK